MTTMLSSGEVVTKLRNLLYSEPAYVWGMNGEQVIPELIQKLKDRYVSDAHTPYYYDEKLKEHRGKKAVDEIGLLNFLSGENLSFQEYLSKAKQVFPAVDLLVNQVAVLCDLKNDGTPTIAVHVGNNNAIKASEGFPGVSEVQVDLHKWNTAFIPHFMDTIITTGTVSSIISQYQIWLNYNASVRGMCGVSVTGYYDDSTRNLSLMLAKAIYGDLVGSHLDVTGNISNNEIIHEIGNTIKNGYDVEEYECLLYIISVRLYAMDLFDTFTEVWGTGEVMFMDSFARRLAATQAGLKRFMLTCRYLDSSKISLPVLRELFL